ncbi:MAG: hypothetical protein LBK53_08360 [Heliobacteriaceae bacterium]|nr:hypothetical protein [Heliobacteriaceae bacterium]
MRGACDEATGKIYNRHCERSEAIQKNWPLRGVCDEATGKIYSLVTLPTIVNRKTKC